MGRGLGLRGREDPDSGGPKERRAPCALGGTAARLRPGGPWGLSALVTLRQRRGPREGEENDPGPPEGLRKAPRCLGVRTSRLGCI